MNILKKLFSLSFIITIIFVSVLPVSADVQDIYIVSTSDMHGNIFKNVEKGTIGYGNIYSIKNSVENSVVVDGGDFLGDTVNKKTTLNENIIYAMNESGYDYALFGENESKYTYEEILEISKNASFKILCSNVTYNDEKIFFEEQIKEVGGKKIGVFGVSEEITNTNGYKYEDPYSAASSAIKKLRSRGAKIIIALVYSKDGTLAEKIAESERDITIVTESGTHLERPQGTLIQNRTLITNTGAAGNAVNVTKMGFDNNKLVSFSTTNYNLKNIETIYPEMNELEEKMKNAQDNITAVTKNVMGKLEKALPLDDSIHYTSAPLGNFLCDVIKEKTEADVVILNSSNIIGGLDKEITQAQVNNLFEKNNNVTVRKITAKSLYNVMEIALNKISTDSKGNIEAEEAENARFMQVSGIKVKYNPLNETGKRIIEFYINGKKITWLNDKEEYLIASTQDVFEGTTEYLAALDVISNYGDVSDIISAYIKDEKNEVKISDETRLETTDAQKQYWWVIGLVFGGFCLVIIIFFIIARLLMYFAR